MWLLNAYYTDGRKSEPVTQLQFEPLALAAIKVLVKNQDCISFQILNMATGEVELAYKQSGPIPKHLITG